MKESLKKAWTTTQKTTSSASIDINSIETQGEEEMKNYASYVNEMLVCISDGHTGSMTGLITPNMFKSQQSKEVKKMGVFYDKSLDSIAEWGVKEKANSTLINFGDDLDNHSKSNAFYTRNRSELVEMGFQTYKRSVELFDKNYRLKGTDAHDGDDGELEELLSSKLYSEYPNKIVRDENNNTYSWYIIEKYFNKVLINGTHHGHVGGKPWTRTNPMLARINELTIDRLNNNKKIPDLIIAGHAHLFADTVDAYKFCRSIQLPCLQLQNGYGYKIKPLSKTDIGILAIMIRPDSTYEVKKYLMPV